MSLKQSQSGPGFIKYLQVLRVNVKDMLQSSVKIITKIHCCGQFW